MEYEMKKTIVLMFVALFSAPALATSNALIDRLQNAGALPKIEKAAQQKLKEFARSPRFNLYGFKIDWNDDSGKTVCVSAQDPHSNFYAGTCLIPYEALHASGFITVIMTTEHKERNADVVIMNAIYE